MATPTNQWKLTVEQKVERLAAAVAALATESDKLAEECVKAGVQIEPRPSMEEQIERILVPEHFSMTAVPPGGVWHA